MNSRGLFRDHFGDFRVSVSERADRDARVEIQKDVAVHIFDHRAVAALHHERVASRVAGRDELLIAFEHLFGLRAGQSRFYFRQIRFCNSLHKTSTNYLNKRSFAGR